MVFFVPFTIKFSMHDYIFSVAKFLHCVRTVCILHTQRLGYSPKNTCHLSRGWGFLEDPFAPRHKANAQMQ